MDTKKNWDVPMSDKAFEDIKTNAKTIRDKYPNEFRYRDEEVNKINNMKNIGSNGMYIVAMFDAENVKRLLQILEVETVLELFDERLPDVFRASIFKSDY